MARSAKTIIENVRVFDGNGFSNPRTITIKDGLISNDAADPDQTIDGKGGFLMPGFIDAHVHVSTRAHLEQLLEAGVTTVLDMAMFPAEKISEMRNLPGPLPDLKTAGVPLSNAGSLHSCMMPLPAESLHVRPEDAATWVRSRIEEGSDYIKIIADVPGPEQELLSTVVDEAHKQEKQVVAHAATHVPWRMALDAKADIVTHLPVDKPLDEQMAELMLAAKLIAVPTLCMMEAVTSLKPDPGAMASMEPETRQGIIANQKAALGKKTYENAKTSLATLHRLGVPILAGTDCHGEPGSWAYVPHGESLHKELELLVDAGLSNVEALRAATLLPAQHFQLEDRGVIEDGKRADLVLLSEDPTKNIQATRSMQRTWLGGVEVNRGPGL